MLTYALRLRQRNGQCFQALPFFIPLRRRKRRARAPARARAARDCRQGMPRAQSRAARICRGAALFGGSALADKQKGNGCCLFMAEGEGFALQRLPIGNAKGTIACSPGDECSALGISKTSPSKRKKNPCRFFLWRKARDSNPRILSHQRFSRPPLSTAQPAFRACKLYHKKRLICKPYRKIEEENQKLPYGTKVVCPYAYSAGRETPCNLIPQA